MNMKRFSIISLLLWIGILAFASGKPKVMWLDCSANFQRFSYPDSIRFYVDKCHEAGITHLVLDIKDNTGEVLYPSKYAAQKKNWKNSTHVFLNCNHNLQILLLKKKKYQILPMEKLEMFMLSVISVHSVKTYLRLV